MAAPSCDNCRVEYRSQEIVIRGPRDEVQREAKRILRRFACSATPYELCANGREEVVLKPA